MEKIKFRNILYTLVPGNQFEGDNLTITFLPGDGSFLDVEAEVKASLEIVVVDDAGEPIMTRSGLVYGGYLAKQENCTIGTEQVENGTNEAGELVYVTQDIVATVMIAKFQVPDLREQLEATQARLAYVEMMSGIEMEV